MVQSKRSLLVDRPAKTLRELALEKMREAIIDLSFKPGERLVERDLCVELGVSRTVVREVLRHLESEGLVVTLGNRGPIVARTSAAEAAQIYEIRGALEAIAARACAEASDKTFVADLETALAAIHSGYETPDWPKVLAATTEFYRILFEAAGKEIAWGIVNSITARINHLRSMTIKTPGRDAAGPTEMTRIVEAIRAGDGEAAHAAALAHVRSAAAIAGALFADQPEAETAKPAKGR
ncbi:GntR family transcriptional regulator [Segnochrobactrum spirostomi]|uniref:GntR family transcriptional regulator n=1 Tax=Segnochrobactrum spirostomi TaxID=2608987 RepID=A0A6A7Y5Z4_9HYPH|nr:GntR family transcriptional regulator [Segnochrobactrum spirostomi]MQT14680.1 GntR family transcriptional regulator [Segnochrobactrum spirostomi]